MSKSVEKYDFEKGNWCKIEDMNQNRKAACAVFMPDGIYVMGGYDGCQYLKSCEKYDFQGRKWKYISDMNYSKCHFSAVTSNDFQFIYTIGGYDSRPLSYIERFDVLSNKWEIIDKLPAPKYRHQSVFVNE